MDPERPGPASTDPSPARLAGESAASPRRLPIMMVRKFIDDLAASLRCGSSARPVLFGFMMISNLAGVALVLVLVIVAIPTPDMFAPEVLWITEGVLPVYVVMAMTFGWVWLIKRVLAGLRWENDNQPLTAKDQRNAFLAPWRLALVPVVSWTIGSALFAVLYGRVSYEYVPKIILGTSLSGIALSATCYFFAELMLRPAATIALGGGQPTRRLAPSVMGRATTSWVLGSGVPLVGIILAVAFAMSQQHLTRNDLGLVLLLLAPAALVSGVLCNMIAAWLTATSVRDLHSALKRVESGDLDCQLDVFDGTELGELQRGFNAMVEGLRQRERIRDLFGRHVGRDVAAAAEDQSFELGGEERCVAVLFVDIIGSTRLVTARPPAEVVRLFNQMFAVIIDEVSRRNGLINKFQGDGTLAIFGAPIRALSPETDALGAARAIAHRLANEVPECQAAIGVAAGAVLAGNVGAFERFEYTVIGEPVNIAARLCELAKSDPHRVLSSAETVQASAPDESQHWTLGGHTVLRGLDRLTQLASPNDCPTGPRDTHVVESLPAQIRTSGFPSNMVR
ncbi:adenylate/guanylate cyclase domain-containing protein [Mycobacterium marinum]|uniref:adenylate/guanylate cyclase domain-containing protein n=1 Tax=Mycobacterium marinum TaxID=1781 RepID=UPI00031C4036|nr:adenylate/guanylate cyclase domain-containing protein [Mycobacterium marinum]EPQ77404.1 Adenylate cyclase [Mycobacterium marinum MB2]MDC8973198.1 adenylate/guanylate cyclase domain-containing protein [Mycobacterium marinum]QQW36551.1 adenylate/guanylate cyclase domain-containing protein [Mycobacterium marinum]RFZ62776.1 Adenylate cyclase 2 [Mycobacterium marinum]